MSKNPPISGLCDSGFERLHKAFLDNFLHHEELGASVALSVDGKILVNLVGGYQDQSHTHLYTAQTLTCIYSTGKAVVALLVALAVERGRLRYDQPVGDIWPAFAAAGKHDITVAQLLSHQAGLCGLSGPVDPAIWLDWDATCQALAVQEPFWAPGNQVGYHPVTYGYLAGEILRRVTGKSVQHLLRDYFYQPFGIEVHSGVEQQGLARIAPMIKPLSAPDLGKANPYKKAAFLEKWSSPRIARAQLAEYDIPASNMHASAAGLVRLMGIVANDGRLEGRTLLGAKTLQALVLPRARSDEDLCLGLPVSWAAGVMCNDHGFYGPEKATVGHSGFGGSFVLADPVNRVCMAYVMNRMSPALIGDPRARALVRAAYDCLFTMS